MLWNVVYEFFLKYVFGGIFRDVNGNLIAYSSAFLSYADGVSYTTIGGDITIFGVPFSLGNYLSLIATIISMIVIVVLACLFIKKIYNMCAHIIV